MPSEVPNVANIVSRAAQECGFERERFIDNALPNDFDKIVVILFLGDLRSLSVLSTLLFKPYCDNVLKDKYVIMCGFPGMGCLFSGANEYWSVSDGLSIGGLMESASGFKNTDKKADMLAMQLRRRFFTVVVGEDLLQYYDNGLNTVYFDRFKKVERFFPAIPNWQGNKLHLELKNRGGHSVFIYPNIYGKCWDRNHEVSLKFPKDFWIKFTERLLTENFLPVIYQNQATYDLSPVFGEKCFYCTDRNFLAVLGAMRSTGCVLDVFSGISRMAIVARCPFLVLDERQRYVKSKEFEVNDLCVNGMYPYRYIFSFPTIIGSGNHPELIDQIINVAREFVPKVAEAYLPPGSESYEEVPYEVVRQHKAKKLGVRFIKVERLVIQ